MGSFGVMQLEYPKRFLKAGVGVSPGMPITLGSLGQQRSKSLQQSHSDIAARLECEGGDLPVESPGSKLPYQLGVFVGPQRLIALQISIPLPPFLAFMLRKDEVQSRLAGCHMSMNTLHKK